MSIGRVGCRVDGAAALEGCKFWQTSGRIAFFQSPTGAGKLLVWLDLLTLATFRERDAWLEFSP